MGYPTPALGVEGTGTTVPLSVPKDVPSAIQVVLSAAQSGSGKARLTTQTGNASEVGALVTLTGSSAVIGAAAAAILVAAGVTVTALSTWDEAVTAIAAS